MTSDATTPAASTSQALNWTGCIPVCLTLAPTSVSSPTIPPPIHVLVARNTYLHVGLESAVQRLHPFAPLSLSFTGNSVLHIHEPDPGPGTLADVGGDSDGGDGHSHKALTRNDADSNSIPSSTPTKTNSRSTNSATYPICWFEDEDTHLAVRWHLFAGVLFDLKTERRLPWRLRLHFTNYPSYSEMILPLESPVLTQVHALYKHSLKQALTICAGHSKTAMNVTKESHGLLWEAVRCHQYALYQRVAADLPSLASSNKASVVPVAIPVRVFVNAVSPPIQRRVTVESALRSGSSSSDHNWTTMGELLVSWVPQHFTSATTIDGVQPKDTVLGWRVCGIQPALSTPILDLWKQLCHPDQFLYIIVLTGE
jgi:autophagy-related protein 5